MDDRLVSFPSSLKQLYKATTIPILQMASQDSEMEEFLLPVMWLLMAQLR